jgi:hypothetical protein
MSFKLNENLDEEYYEVGDFFQNTQNKPVEKLPKNRRKQAKIYDRIETFTSKEEMKEFIDSNNMG